jgi:hypothetical protein
VQRVEPACKKTGQEGVTMAAKIRRGTIKTAPYDSADYLKTDADINTTWRRYSRSPWIGRC